MANEITVTTSMQCVNGTFTTTYAPGSVRATQTTKGKFSTTVTIGTSETDVTISNLTTPGLVFLRNLDATNRVEWGPKSAGSMVLCGNMLASDPPSHFRLGGSVTLRMKAYVASCQVQIDVLET